jgi:hypothetical protein
VNGKFLFVTADNAYVLNEAKSEYYKAIAISPHFSYPYTNLIKIALFNKSEVEIQAVLDKVKSNFSEEYYLTQAFYSYYYFGDSEKAKKFGLELINKYPNNSSDASVLMLNLPY